MEIFERIKREKGVRASITESQIGYWCFFALFICKEERGPLLYPIDDG